MKYAGLFQRLLANSIESETYSHAGTPCWEYMGYRIRRGYGRLAMRRPGKPNPQGMAAHRVMAEVVTGRTLHPDDETIEHACGIPWCINYLHFELATRPENTANMQRTRSGRPRKVFQPLINQSLYSVDPLERSMPVLRSSLSEECPF